MTFQRSPFAPDQFPNLPSVQGVQSATASRGFYAGRGIERDDVFLFVCDPGTVCAGVFTRSETASADVMWCRDALRVGGGNGRALIVNSGNSNAFTGPKGRLKNDATLAALQASLDLPKETCFLGATGVIGEPLPDPNYVGSIVPQLVANLGPVDWQACAEAFMTTDTYPKAAGDSVKLGETTAQLAGISKGSGMIAPNMATMLAYVFTDTAITADILQVVLGELCDRTFNAITVDGDTSTSDSLMVFATGQAGNAIIDRLDHPDLPAFKAALERVLRDLALQIVKDGEGASKFVTIHVEGARDARDAKRLASAIGNSPLVKTALAASDANWGRIVMAVGNAGVRLDLNALSIWFGPVQVAKYGARAEDYDEALASAQCAQSDIEIRISVGAGAGQFTLYTCDLTHAYIDINGAYRT